MKTELSSIDVAAVVSELRELAGSRIEKIYAHTDDEIRLNIYRFSEGRVNLIIKPGHYLFLTDHARKSPKIPPAFAMMLRKHLMSGRITEIRQYDFDRVVEIVVTRAEITSVLVVELFNPGNIILLDSDRRILLPMKPVTFKGRRIRSGEEYVYPKAQISPIDVTKEELHSLLASSDSNIVRALASNLNMGGKIAEEVCTQAGVDKSITALQVTDEIVSSIYDGLAKTFEPVISHNLKPQVVCKKEDSKAEGSDAKPESVDSQDVKPESADQYIDVMPFDLSEYKDAPRKYFDSFNKALDAYFSPKVMEKSAAAAEVEVKVVESALVRRLRQQEDAIGTFEAKKGNLSAKGEAIYGNYQMVMDVINVITGARGKGYSWKDILSILKGAKAENAAAAAITGIDEKTQSVTVKLGDVSVSLDVEKTPEQNAQVYYDKAKKLDKKMSGAVRAIEVTKKLLEKENAAPKPKKSMQVRQKKHWYDRFRWFETSDGFLVVGGRDATANEELMKKYAEPKDVVFHSQAHGAPITILKRQGHDISEVALSEAAQFAVSYSSVWKSGQVSGDCYWVKPEQVTKTPESGEFLPKGSFVIRGERNYFKDVAVSAAIGLEIGKETLVIGGPLDAIKARCEYIVEIQPGEYNQSDIAKKMYRQMADDLEKDYGKQFLKKVASPDAIVKMLPAGGSRVVRAYKTEKK